MSKVIISSKNFSKIKEKILGGGIENLHVLADFDKTLTKAHVNGVPTSSIISELRNRNILSEDYQNEAKRLFSEYHPIELDHTLEPEVRDAKMKEWWIKIFDLLIKERVNLSHLKEVIEAGKIELREGVSDMLKFLRDHKIPLVILSASGIGDLIPMYLEKQGLLYKNITIVSNFFEWDSEGYARFPKPPIIHSENKGEAQLEKLEIYKELEKRKNVLLLGDSLGDVEMIGEFPYENLIKIGFLNEEIDKRMDAYKEIFDLIIPNDGDINFVNEFLNEFKL
ncbi:hypothetical protein GW932_00345 [archaeon]|nr:hypothetical protein [archaeon]